LAALITLTSLSGQLCAQDTSVSFTVRGHWPDYQRGSGPVAVRGHYVYVGNGIFDVTNPAKPVRLSSIEGGFPGASPSIAGNYLYALRGQAGLVIWDITQPEHPVMAGVLQTGYTSEYYPHVFQVSGNYAYLLSGDGLACNGGLEVVDIRNPAQPVVTGRLAIDAQLWDLAVSGNHAYVNGGGCLWIIDVSNPAQPACTLTNFGEDVFCWRSLAVTGNYAYVMEDKLGLVVLNVSDPTWPILVGWSAATGGAIQLAGNHAYVWTQAQGGYDPQLQGLEVFDLTNPARPVRIGECKGPGLGSAQVAGDYAYAVWDGMLQAIDLTDPAHPVRLDGLLIEGLPNMVRVRGNRAYLAENYALHVLDVSDPGRPVLLSTVKCGFSELRYIALDPARPYVYAVEYRGDETGVLVVFDVSDPTAPVRIAEANFNFYLGCSPRIRCSGDEVFISGNYLGRGPWPIYTCFDVRNPAQPVEIPGLVLTERGIPTVGMSVAGHYLYLPYEDSVGGVPPTLYVVDISVPGSPVVVGTAVGPWPPDNGSWLTYTPIHVLGHYAYLQPYRESQFDVFDVSIPATPVSVGACQVERLLRYLQVEGQYAYVAVYRDFGAGPLRLRVIDVRDPTQPRLLDGAYEHELGGFPQVSDEPYQVVGNLIYLADGWGLTIVEVELPGTLKLKPPVRSGNTLTLSWKGGPGIKLQRTASLANASWQDVAGSEGVSQITVPCTEPAAFFRLIKP
jgi:hypothetical protein